MADSSLAVIKGVIARLLAYNNLTGLVSTRVYTNTPQPTTFPYVVMDITSEPFAQFDSSNMQHTVILHAFSRTSSLTEAIQIAEECYNALDRQESNISLDSGNLLLCIFDGLKNTFKEPDGITWHSVIRFKIIVD